MNSRQTTFRARARATTLSVLTMVGAGALATTAAYASTHARAATSVNRIHVHGPKANAYHTYFNETVSGHASGGANYVISGEQLNKGSGCAATYKLERIRSDFYPWTTGTGPVHGSFSLVAKFWARNHGTHGICSYLIHHSTGKTYAKAGLFWTNS